MRIAIVTTSYPTHQGDPSGHFVRSELRTLVAKGHEVTLFAPRASGSLIEPRVHHVALPHGGLFGWPGALARVRQNPTRLLGVLPFVWSATRELTRRSPFDSLIAHWIVPCFWPILNHVLERADFSGILSGPRGNDLPITVVVHGSDARLLARLPTPLQRRILTALCRPDVHVRCVSSELLTLLSRHASHLGLTLRSTSIEPCTLDIPSLPPKEELRRELGVTLAPLVVVVGRAVKTKRIELAVLAVKNATGRAPTIIGDGPERASLMNEFPDATWLGQLPRDDTLRWIAAADLLVSASANEGAPTVIREAIALGTRVVAVKCGDLQAWAQANDGLIVVPEANPHRLTPCSFRNLPQRNNASETTATSLNECKERPKNAPVYSLEPQNVLESLTLAIRQSLATAPPHH